MSKISAGYFMICRYKLILKFSFIACKLCVLDKPYYLIIFKDMKLWCKVLRGGHKK